MTPAERRARQEARRRQKAKERILDANPAVLTGSPGPSRFAWLLEESRIAHSTGLSLSEVTAMRVALRGDA